MTDTNKSRTDILKQAEAKLAEALALMDTLSAPYEPFEQQARTKIIAGIDALCAAAVKH